jgi:predicted deacetylase
MKVAVRDDDTCYFTTPQELERVYAGIWERVPICLATIPFAKGYKSPAVPPAYWTSGEAFALERNGEICGFLRELRQAGRVTIALHGYTHEDFPDGWEFQAAPDPHRRVREGHAYLRALLDTPISIFVPPHNALSKAGLDAVRRQRLNLLGSFLSFHPARRPFEWDTLPNWWRIQRFRAHTGRTRRDPMVYPFPLRYRHHAEFGCHSLIPSTTLQDLVRGFEEARAHRGDFCIATHYWEVDDRLRGILTDFLDHASRHSDVRFVSAEELFARA